MSECLRGTCAPEGPHRRVGVIERVLRIVVLTSDDVLRLVQAAVRLRGKSAAPAPPPEEETAVGAGDIASLAFGALCLLLIVLAPQITGATPDAVAAQLLHEITPVR